MLLYRSYDDNGVTIELDKVKDAFPNKEGANMADGLKKAKEELFDKTARDWVNQVTICWIGSM